MVPVFAFPELSAVVVPAPSLRPYEATGPVAAKATAPWKPWVRCIIPHEPATRIAKKTKRQCFWMFLRVVAVLVIVIVFPPCVVRRCLRSEMHLIGAEPLACYSLQRINQTVSDLYCNHCACREEGIAERLCRLDKLLCEELCFGVGFTYCPPVL